MQQKNSCLNALKGAACILVVLNHFHWNGIAGDITYIVSHLGVPVFFLTSGYFLLGGGDRKADKLPKKIFHAWRLLLVHLLLYVYNFFFETIFLAEVIVSKSEVLYQLRAIFSLEALKSSLKWSMTLYGSAQWFLIALLEAYVLLYVLYKLGLGRILEKYSLVISCFLFLVHIPVRILIVKLGITDIWGMDTAQTAIVRNTLFDALPFMLLGVWLKGNAEKVKLSDTSLIAIALTGIVISIFESYITEWLVSPYTVGCVLYFGTITADFCLFLYAINNASVLRGGILEHIGERLSMIIYFIHPLVGKYIQISIGNETVIYRYSYPVIVVLISIIAAQIISRIMEQQKRVKLKYTAAEPGCAAGRDKKETAILILCTFILLFSVFS